MDTKTIGGISFSPLLHEKEYVELNEEDKIIFEHLLDRHKYFLSHVNELDTKIAQIIALSGVILGLIVTASVNNIKSIQILIIIGITSILIGMSIGAIAYYPRLLLTGTSKQFFIDYDTFPNGVGIKLLKIQLLADIENNKRRLCEKATYFSVMLLFVLVGLIIVMVGYYA